MKSVATLSGAVLAMSLFVCASCSEGPAEAVKLGGVTLNITDTPLEDETLTGVWLTVVEIDFHTSDGTWRSYEGSIPVEPINLLELTGGQTVRLGTNVPTPAGHYTGVRFLLDAPENGGGAPSNPGCFLTYDDDNNRDTPDTEVPLFVPSGSTSGFKGVGGFTVPINGDVTITADLDLRKSLPRSGSHHNPRYLLKPAIRLAVEGDAGWVSGRVVAEEVPTVAAAVVAFAYADGSWSASEANSAPGASDSGFENAVTSDYVDFINADSAESAYKLVFLAPGVYDLAVAVFDTDGAFLRMWGFYNNATVTDGKGVKVDLTNGNLTATLN